MTALAGAGRGLQLSLPAAGQLAAVGLQVLRRGGDRHRQYLAPTLL